MSDPTGFSVQTTSVLAALSSTPTSWRHGYDLAKKTGLKSGTLYPILIRLADRGLVEAVWEAEQPAGRPRRHLYRLTAAGLHAARAASTTPEPVTRAAARRPGRRRIAIEGTS
jgi:PadR family transcriptional regulator, regulatory protein PadR